VLYDVVCQEDGPGYMFQLKKGATTMTETWDCYPDWSQNHCMLGHAEEWFYRGLGGVRSDPSGPGFKRFIVAPQVVGGLTSATASYQSMYGTITSDWKRQGDSLTLDVTVPVNTSAMVYLPAKDAANVTESGKPAAQAEGVKFLRSEGGAAVYEVVSGSYRFAGKM
jgi:alpha-L-rhamnosidase